VSLVNVDDELYAVVAGNGRVRCDRVGTAADAHREVGFARFALRRAAMGRPADLSAVSASLQRSLLGPVARSIGADPVIIVPSSRLHDVPWALLPCLSDVPMAVAPSAALWLRASEQPEPADRPVVVVVGPGLSTGDQEATTVARIHQRPTTLLGADATVGNTLAAFNGAWIGHVAAHGVFRADSPLFSSLQLADGPLTIHDLDRLRRPPHTVLLSACDSAVSVPVGSEELLGLVTGLLGMGTASVLASVVPVNDAATVSLMVNVHAALRDGSSLPEALLVARSAAKADPSTLAAAVSFTAWGG
jgi:CHAT domain-containing protein